MDNARVDAKLSFQFFKCYKSGHAPQTESDTAAGVLCFRWSSGGGRPAGWRLCAGGKRHRCHYGATHRSG